MILYQVPILGTSTFRNRDHTFIVLHSSQSISNNMLSFSVTLLLSCGLELTIFLLPLIFKEPALMLFIY